MMKTLWRGGIWVAGIVLLVGSVAGTSWLLNWHGDDQPVSRESTRVKLNPGPNDPANCAGRADLPSRVLELLPVRQGRVDEINVKEGQEVHAGDVLLKLDDRPARYALAQAEADVKAGEAKLAQAKLQPEQHRLSLQEQQKAIDVATHKLAAAKKTAERAKRLADATGGGPVINDSEAQAASEVQKAAEAALEAEKTKLEKLRAVNPQTEIDLAEADLVAKKSRRDQAKYAVDECVLRAPQDGKILRILIGKGELVAGDPKQSVIQFAPHEALIIRAEVDQEYANLVNEGYAATIYDDTRIDKVWKGKVVRKGDWYTRKRSTVLEPLQFNDVRTLECIIALDPGQEELRIGQRVRITIEATR
jgi:multidrug resistance efflux pump